MDTKELVNRLMERGVLVSPDVIGSIDEANMFLLGKEELVVTEVPEPLEYVVEVPEEKESIGVEEVTAFYREKFEGLRGMLMKKLEPVSISNVSKGYSDVAVIGMVSEVTSQGYVLEDDTGSVEILSSEKPMVKDVVGVKGSVREGKLMEKEVVYPDIPLPKGAAPKLKLRLSPKRMDFPGIQLVMGEGESKDNLVFIPRTPAKLRIKGVHVLVFQGDGVPELWLKKRHLPEKVASSKDYYLIDKPPSLFWVISDEVKSGIYKGVLVVQTNLSSYADVNLETGEAVFDRLE